MLALFGAAAAGPLEDGQAAYQRGDYAEAMRLLSLLAEQGNAAAQGNLGAMQHQGLGVPDDDAQAVVWFRKAAEQGYAPAQAVLGAAYHAGRGVRQDYAQAVVWFRKAAEQENAGAVRPRRGVRHRPRRAVGLRAGLRLEPRLPS